MDEIQSQKADVASMLRSVVQSAKGGVLVTNVQREYRLLVGEGIPFKKLGYRSLEDLLRDMPDVIRISRNSMGEMVLHAIADESTAHIASLIARQKGAKTNIKTKMPRRRPVRHSHSWKPQTPQYLPRMNPPPKLNFSSNYSNSFSVAQNKTTPASRKQFEESRESNFNSQPPPLQKVPSMRKPKPPRIRNLPPRLRNQQVSPSPVVPLASDNYTTFTSSSSSSSPPSLSPPPPLSPSASLTPAPTLSSANNYVRADHPPPLLHMASNREIVNSYANAHGLTITFRNLPLNPREFPLTYISTLRIGSQKFNSYPNDKPTIEGAEEEAARVAVESLDLRPGMKSQFPITNTATAEDMKIFVDRILQIIDGKQNGLWSMKVESEFKEKYREVLPSHWITLISAYRSKIQVSQLEGDRSILYPVQNDDMINNREYLVKTPEQLILPNSEYWDVYVSYVTSTVDIAIQLFDYSESFDKLNNDMQVYYEENRLPIQKVEEGRLYAVKIDNCWNRVRVVNVMDDLAECYFVDHGDSEIVAVKCLYNLDPKFASLPFQAIKCQLRGLSEYADNKITLHHLTDKDLLLGKTLVAEVISREDPISLVLYDTSTSDDININDYLIKITEKETITPKLPKEGGIAEIYLSHVDEDGNIFIQVCGPALRLLENLINEFSNQCEKSAENAKSVTVDKMYCINHNNNWYRAVVKKMPTGDNNYQEVEMICVDYGNCVEIPKTNIYELGQLYDVLSGLPYQALKCQLHGIPPSEDLEWSEKTTKHLLKLTPDYKVLLLKVFSEADMFNCTSANVELFKRIEPSDELVSINQTLALTPENFKIKNNSFMNNVTVTTHLNKEKKLSPLIFHSDPLSEQMFSKPIVSSPIQCFTPQDESKISLSKHYAVITPDGIGEQVDNVLTFEALKPPTVPDENDYFDVHVINTAHPYNFTCQSWKQGDKLDELFQDMQTFYSSEDNQIDMEEYLLKQAQFYAGKDNGKWKRVWLKDILGDGMVLAYLVDYGGYSFLKLTDLQPLWKYFRSLPFQAISSELYGVEPIHGDWTPDQCMQFKELVDGKDFVSVIKKKQLDTTTGFPSEKLTLMLIDTSDPKDDVVIAKLLADTGIVKLTHSDNMY